MLYYHNEELIDTVKNNNLVESENSNIPIPTLEVFPNPFVSEIAVKIEMQQPDAILFHLYNEAGQLLFAETHELPIGTQTVLLDLNRKDLPEGLYFLRISDSIGEVRTKRIVKVRP